jgi:hypothetical protein
MRILQLLPGIVILLALAHAAARAADLPGQVQSNVCRAAPEIDGVIGDDEWREAPPMEFAMKMVQVNSAELATRVCQLRVMNSANGLYLALQAPDPTDNDSLNPVNLDAAILAFCRSTELRSGDDRKVVAPGLYVDKHVTEPGKDADDAQQDGRGAMTHHDGIRCVEWAIPLNSGDVNDVQLKPGDSVRLNLAYFDGFQADLKGTQVGVAWPGDLDHAANWGTIQLAADVADDGGRAFKGPVWVQTLLSNLSSTAARRLRLVYSTLVAGKPQPIAKALVEYTYLDTQGQEQVAKAKLFLPATLQDSITQYPLFYAAGYELDDLSSLMHVRRGFVVVSPRDPKNNPLVQTVNPDAALLHIARALPWVDDARVVIGGGSAGGYMTLMLAAETFPLAGAAADVPPMNWGYNAAYFLQRKNWGTRDDASPAGSELTLFNSVAPIADQAVAVYGDDPDDPIWFRNGPLAQLDTITCPVLAYWTTADMLVPIEQISKDWVRPFDPNAFPVGYTRDPDQLSKTSDGRLRFLEVFPTTDYELFSFTEEQVRDLLPKGSAPPEPAELPFSRTKRWSVVILDEGAPEPRGGHTKYPVPWLRNLFIDHAATGPVSALQLTPVKLARLMDRYAGQEWLPTRVKHLDFAEQEKADVIRGLTTYVAAGAESAATFAELYRQLPAARQVLEPEVYAAVVGAGK